MHEARTGERRPSPRTGDAPASSRPAARAIAWRIPLLYLLFGVLWIVASDHVVALLVSGDAAAITRFQTWKGALYMVATAALLYLLLRPLVERLLDSQRQALDSEARYRELFEGNPSPMWTYDLATLKILDANQAASAFLGWSRGELRGMDMVMLWPPEQHGFFHAGVEVERSAPELPRAWIERLRVSDGSFRDVELRSSEIARGGQRVRLVVVSDRTAELQSQRAREQAMARLQEAQRLARLGSWEVEAATLRGRFCPILLHLVGQAAGDERPRRLGDVLVAADAESQARLDRLLAEMAAGRAQKLDVLLPFTGPGGQERLLRLRAQRIEESGRGFLRGTAQDVTEEQHTRQLLDEREQQFRELVRILPDGLMILAGERVFYANPACGGLFGRQPEELYGEPLSALVADGDLPALRAWLDGGELPGGAARMRRGDGTPFRAAL
ncbi:MAG TPA: PAS domain S-box protein, partial [Pseudoxanthomonas sp.]|nr:PAS domain S-box protein [Pseudoxanthomonas sp.]